MANYAYNLQFAKSVGSGEWIDFKLLPQSACARTAELFVGHLEVQPCIAAQDLDGDRDLPHVGAGLGQLPGTAPPRQLLRARPGGARTAPGPCSKLCNKHGSKHLRVPVLLEPERKISASPNRQFQGGDIL